MPGEFPGGDDDICGFNSQLLSFSTQTSLLTSSTSRHHVSGPYHFQRAV